MSSIISIRNLVVEYGSLKALDEVSLDIREGEVVCIIGPSGCGKTTLATVILGITTKETKIRGEVKIAGIDILNDKRLITKVYKEVGIGYVTQADTLLPWRTLLKNVLLPCEVKGINHNICEKTARELLKMVGLNGFENHYPHQLSGGMRQRAQLVRALMTDPKILVMDEPFGALDALTRVELQKLLTAIIASTRKTVIFITHDLEEAITIGTKVVVMSKRPGRIKAIQEIEFPYPRNPYELRGSKRFEEIKQRIWKELTTEVVEAEA